VILVSGTAVPVSGAAGKAARREFAVVLALAAAGVALASIFALTPWQPDGVDPGLTVVHIQPPPALSGGAAAGAAVGSP
jgi:hypothetical protein